MAESGAARRLAHGSASPVALLKNWRSSPMTVISAMGAPSSGPPSG
jgi:hypothetical protein